MQDSLRIKIGENELLVETGRMAKQSNGAVFATYGGTAVLATVCCGRDKVEGIDYVPLQVEYNEKQYAAGKIPGGWFKREGRPREKEILVSRLIDRPMRPLFFKGFGREIQIVPTTVSADMINPPDVIAMIASSLAVVISDIPFAGPVGAVRIGLLDDNFIVNPTFDQIEKCRLDIVVAGTEDGITMVEGGAREVSEELLMQAIELAFRKIREICAIQKEMQKMCGKPKIELPSETVRLPVENEIRSSLYTKLADACFLKGKHNRSNVIHSLKEEGFKNWLTEADELSVKLYETLFEEMEKEIVRKSILDKGVRTDGRGLEDIRPITCEINVLPRAHGSALFTRGETQSLGITTLGTVSDEQVFDDIDGDRRAENFMLHYNFPPFSVGETGRMGTGRREIGHGNLAQRALTAVLPGKDSFPYTIRVVSEILESNGSSSMASVCSGTLSLLHAGVPIRKPVAGIAMGLVTGEDRVAILSDILGEEDHLGDMDFKVAGTEDGITAFQMDIKIAGVSFEVMRKAVEQAKRGRLQILKIMNETIGVPNSSLSQYAPRVITFKVDEDKIGTIIGSGGKTIKGITEKTGVEINIEQDGTVIIYSRNQEKAEEAEKIIRALIAEPEVGQMYTGTVKRIMDFGAFVEFLPGKEGLCHISKLSRKRINKVTDVLEVGQEIPIKIIEIDRLGRVNLSYIDALETQNDSENG